MLDRLNTLPSLLASYDTTEPWSRFLGTTAMGFISVIPLSMFVLGIWLAAGALRRRVGIPMMGADRRAVLWAGMGLGAVIFAASSLPDFVSRGVPPRGPSTTLDLAVPMLDHLAGIPSSTLMMVSIVAIPILVLLGVTAKWSMRVLIVAAACAVVVGAAALAPSTGAADPARVAAGIGALGLMSLAIYLWGGVSAVSWLIAALATQAFGGLAGAVHAATSQEKVAGVLTVFVVASIAFFLSQLQTGSETEKAATF